MSQRISTDQASTRIALVAFKAANGSGDHGGGGGHGPDGASDHWNSRRSPWDMGLYALLAALMVAFFVLMAGKAVQFERERSTSSREGVGRGVGGAGVAAELSRNVAPTP